VAVLGGFVALLAGVGVHGPASVVAPVVVGVGPGPAAVVVGGHSRT
jgi:hypothetical protein